MDGILIALAVGLPIVGVFVAVYFWPQRALDLAVGGLIMLLIVMALSGLVGVVCCDHTTDRWLAALVAVTSILTTSVVAKLSGSID